jgi:hypothetical protein
MTVTPNEPNGIATHLSEIFGIEWDPNIMTYEEPHIFRTASTLAANKEAADAER